MNKINNYKDKELIEKPVNNNDQKESNDDDSTIAELVEEKSKEVVSQAIVSKMQIHQGPLPPASEFEKYEKTCPGAADRILKMAEEEQQIQKQHLTITSQKQYNFTLIIGIFSLIVALFAFYYGYSTAGLIIAITGSINTILKNIFKFIENMKKK